MRTLTEIATTYPTDKLHKHGYIPVYDRIMSPNRETVKNVLEIGIYGGDSLRTWQEFFPNATIYGIDIDKSTFIEGERIKCMYGNQSSVEDLNRLRAHFIKEGVKFDYIVDDGSHTWSDQILSFLMFKDLLTDEGKYFIEDVYVTNVEETVEYAYKPIMENFKDFALEVYDGREELGLHDEVMLILGR